MFDEYYLQRYGDVAMSDMKAHEHFDWLGKRLGRTRALNDGPALPDEGCHLPLWEDRSDPNCSTYGPRRPYPQLHPVAAKAAVERYRHLRETTQADIAFVTAISGYYDTPKLHEHFLPNADYYLFGDTISEHFMFKIRPLPYFHIDPTRMARFVKTHLHSLVGGTYKVAVWVDGNILIRGDLSDEIEAFMQSGLPIAAIPHPLRSSVYVEGQTCIDYGKDGKGPIEQQLRRYRDAGFQSDWLIESNFMMFRLDHPRLEGILKTWWGEIDGGSRRDQLSLPYAIHSHNADWFSLTASPSSVRDHPKLVLSGHQAGRELAGNLAATGGAITPELRFVDRKRERIAAQCGRSVDIVVCVHNALECVQRCLRSVDATRSISDHRLIIVNDGSDAETSAWLRSFQRNTENCCLIEHKAAKGYTKAANAGMGAAKGEVVILLNSDTEVAPNWIGKLLDTFDAFPGIGIVGPMSNAASHQSLPQHRSSGGQTAINALPSGFDVQAMDEWCEQQAREQAYTLVPLVHGFCIAFRKKVLDAVGHFDEASFPDGYGEENDICLRASSAGFLLAVALHTFVYHEKSMSYETEKRVSLMKAGSAKLHEKHSKERVSNCVRSMQANPDFVRLRYLSSQLFA